MRRTTAVLALAVLAAVPAALAHARPSDPRDEAAARLAALRAFAAEAGADPAPVLDWDENGRLIADGPGAQAGARVVTDGAGGGIFVFMDAGLGATVIRAHRLNGDGDKVAGWPDDGRVVGDRDSSAVGPEAAPDGAGGAYVVFSEATGGSLAGLYVTRVDGDGTFATGHTAAGKPVGASFPLYWDVVADATGAYVTWFDVTTFSSRVQRVTGTGDVAAGWPADGIPISTGALYAFPVIRSDGAGGVYAVTASEDTIIVRRLTVAGTNAVGWTDQGVRVTDASAPDPDAALLVGGDLMIAWEHDETGTSSRGIRALRITSLGSVAAGWNAAGNPVVDAAGDQVTPRLVSDLTGGAIASWLDEGAAVPILYATRVRADGSLDPAWPAGGRLLSDMLAEVYQYVAHPDGAGGALYGWTQGSFAELDVHSQKVLVDGSIPANWPADGQHLSKAPNRQEDVRITGDGSGGLIGTWTDNRDTTTVRVYGGRVAWDGTVGIAATLVEASATPAGVHLHWWVDQPGAPCAIERREGEAAWSEIARLRADDLGRVVWDDAAVAAGGRYGYRLIDVAERRVVSEVTVTVPRATARLELAGFRPNPPDGRFLLELALPAAGGARLEVLDVRGRRVMSRDLALGAGRHVVGLGELKALPAGLYFVAVEQGGRRAVTRLLRID